VNRNEEHDSNHADEGGVAPTFAVQRAPRAITSRPTLRPSVNSEHVTALRLLIGVLILIAAAGVLLTAAVILSAVPS
jgi:hypothetical protein